MANLTVDKVTIRMYQVGFGDCFLLIFHCSDDSERFVLVDFGSTGLPKDFSDAERKQQMMNVAANIKARCNGKLHAVVATHRHADHISGFSSKADGTTGGIIRDCQPDFVVMPWTENPVASADAQSLVANDAMLPPDDKNRLTNGTEDIISSLQSMNLVAAMVESEARRLGNKDTFMKPLSAEMTQNLVFMGANNSGTISNADAVENLQTMGRQKTHYVNFGYDLDLSSILPNVKIHVLGPPNLLQYDKIKKERSSDKEEFWMLQGVSDNFWQMQAATADLTANLVNEKEALFPNAEVFDNFAPSHVRWFVRQLREVRAKLLLNIVTVLDDAMNNTSVILLFEIGGKKLLFPGDAQIENWEYALKFADNKDEILKLLSDTTLYKVGHHGSRNATPHTLWDNFAHKSQNNDDEHRLTAMMSTMPGKHGHKFGKNGEPMNTEVPRETLLKELRNNSKLSTTQDITDTNTLFEEVVIVVSN